jgi:hypothetical protein
LADSPDTEPILTSLDDGNAITEVRCKPPASSNT